jgi:ketosteroid isomerase-like protein
MTAASNIESVKQGYAAFSAGDGGGALQFFSDDVEWIFPGNCTISGTYRGKAEVARLWAILADKSMRTEPEHFLGDDERVVVLTRVTVGGESFDEADVLTFRDGKVVKFQSAGDTAAAVRIWG